MTTVPVPQSRRIRPTIALKITSLVLLAIVMLAGVGMIAVNAVSTLRGLSTDQSALNSANAKLIDLDMQQNIASLSLAWAVLATVDAERTTAGDLLTSVSDTVTSDLAAIEKLSLPASVGTPLETLAGDYQTYLGTVRDKMTAAQATDPGSKAAKEMIADDQTRSSAISKEITSLRDQLAGAVRDGDKKAASTATRTRVLAFLSLLAAVVLLGGIGWVLVQGIRKALNGLRERMVDIAEGDGDLTARLPEEAGDETGDVARAINRFIERVQALVRQMAGAAETLGGSVHTLSSMTAEMSANAGNTNGQAAAASDAADDVSRNISTLSAGSEQMSASIREIAQSAAEAAQVANTAVDIAASARVTVSALADASTEIENVVHLITSIAEQTNLPALNATIEAARAGESGKGFAVVAGEVKELAQETAKATEDITQRVAHIQSGTIAAVDAITTIGEIVTKISDYSTTIASAVEEQTATTNEMARSVSEAAEGANQIAGNINQVAGGASSTSEAAAEASRTTSTVSNVVEDLRATVGTFRY